MNEVIFLDLIDAKKLFTTRKDITKDGYNVKDITKDGYNVVECNEIFVNVYQGYIEIRVNKNKKVEKFYSYNGLYLITWKLMEEAIIL